MAQESTSRSGTLKRYGPVALAFLHIGVGRGLHGTFGVFFVAMLDAFGWSRALTAGAISLAIIFEGACLPWVGGVIDRFGGRRTLMFGGLVLFVGLGFASTISSIWQFYFWIGIVSAAGIALIGMVPHVAIITREFPERRGTAFGIAWAGGGVGIVLLVPVAQLMVDRWDWSMAYLGLAAITALLVIPPVQFFLPASRSNAPAEATPATAEKTGNPRPTGRSSARLPIPLFGCFSSRACWPVWATRSSSRIRSPTRSTWAMRKYSRLPSSG